MTYFITCSGPPCGPEISVGASRLTASRVVPLSAPLWQWRGDPHSEPWRKRQLQGIEAAALKLAESFGFLLAHLVEAAECVLHVVIRTFLGHAKFLANLAVRGAGDAKIQGFHRTVRLGGIFARWSKAPKFF